MINTVEQARESASHLEDVMRDIKDPKIKAFYTQLIVEKAVIYGTENHAQAVGTLEKVKHDYLNKLNK